MKRFSKGEKAKLEALPITSLAKVKDALETEYVVATAKEYEGILVVEVFKKAYNYYAGTSRPAFVCRVFVGEDRHETQMADMTWTSAMLSTLVYGWAENFVDDESEMIYKSFMKKNGHESLDSFQRGINCRKTILRNEKKRLKVAALNKPLKPLSRSQREFLEEGIFDENYAVFKSGSRFEKTPREMVCTACKSHFTKAAKNGDKLRCPVCKKPLTVRGQKVVITAQRATGMILQKADENICFRLFNIWRSMKVDENLNVTKRSNAIEIYRMFDNAKELSPNSTVLFKKNGEWKETSTIGGYMKTNPWKEEKLYTRNVRAVLKGTVYEHAPLVEFTKAANFATLDTWRFPYLAVKNPLLESMVKVGFLKVAVSYIHENCYSKTSIVLNEDERSLPKALGLEKPVFRALKNPSPGIVYILQKMSQNGIKQDIKVAEAIAENGYEPNAFVEILKETTAHKAFKYLKKANADVTIWKDYVSFSHLIGEKEVNLFPKDLVKAHDVVVKAHKVIEDEKKREKFAQLAKESEFKDYGDGDYKIVVPSSPNDLVKESEALSHCVKGYIDRVAKEETTILFVRKKDEVSKPFVTIEVKGGRLIQTRGYENSNPNKEVRDFVKKFCTSFGIAC